MRRALHKLSAVTLKGLPDGKHEDGGGLRFARRSDGSAAWVLRFTVHGRRREMRLGPFPAISLRETDMNDWIQRHEVELIELANSDPLSALGLLEKLAKEDVKIAARVAMHVATRRHEIAPPLLPKRSKDSPPRSLADYIARLKDGKTALDNKPLSKLRTHIEIERCKSEYRGWLASCPPENDLE